MSTSTSVLRFEISLADRRVSGNARERMLADPGFGRIFSEHMVQARWDSKRGWHDAQLKPYSQLSLDTGTSMLHYA